MNEAYNLESVTAWLAESHRPLLISHRRPDGDALGALAGMGHVLRQNDCEPVVVLYDALPARYAFLEDAAQWLVWADVRDVVSRDCDGVVIVDTCAVAQLEPIGEFLARAPRILVIDHHATRDQVGTRDGDLRYFDETASATCLIIAEWLNASGHKFDRATATALFTGIATDCGWFRFSNTDGRTMRMASELVAAGAKPAQINHALHLCEPPEKLKLIAHLLNKLELLADGRLAVMRLRQADFDATGADDSMTEDLVNEATRLGGTEATLLVTEESETSIRVNFRSKRSLDVAALAMRFGGGGHTRAAGARLRGKWDDVVPRLIAETIEAL